MNVAHTNYLVHPCPGLVMHFWTEVSTCDKEQNHHGPKDTFCLVYSFLQRYSWLHSVGSGQEGETSGLPLARAQRKLVRGRKQSMRQKLQRPELAVLVQIRLQAFYEKLTAESPQTNSFHINWLQGPSHLSYCPYYSSGVSVVQSRIHIWFLSPIRWNKLLSMSQLPQKGLRLREVGFRTTYIKGFISGMHSSPYSTQFKFPLYRWLVNKVPSLQIPSDLCSVGLAVAYQ